MQYQINLLLDQLLEKVVKTHQQKQKQALFRQGQTLSFPYRAYNFGNVITNYYNPIFNFEIVRCKKFLESLRYSQPTTVVLSIGSLIDDEDWLKSRYIPYIHLPLFLRLTGLPCQIICIAPLHSEIPKFIELERKAGNNWVEIGFLAYQFFDQDTQQYFTYHHFNSLFPEFQENDMFSIKDKKVYWKGTDKRVTNRYASLFGKAVSKISKDDFYELQFKQGIDENLDPYFNDVLITSPSQKDVKFVKSFLDTMGKWMSKIKESGNILTILNFAVFANKNQMFFDYFCESFYSFRSRPEFSNTIFLSFMHNVMFEKNEYKFKINYFKLPPRTIQQLLTKSDILQTIGIDQPAFLKTIEIIIRKGSEPKKMTILTENFE